MIHHLRFHGYMFSEVEIRFGIHRVSNNTHHGIRFYDTTNLLCATHGMEPTIAKYDHYQCEGVLTGNTLTVQKLAAGELEIAEIDIMVMIKTGTGQNNIHFTSEVLWIQFKLYHFSSGSASSEGLLSIVPHGLETTGSLRPGFFWKQNSQSNNGSCM